MQLIDKELKDSSDGSSSENETPEAIAAKQVATPKSASWFLAAVHFLTTPLRVLRSARRAATPVSTRLTREGWQFLFMICFVILGAVLRDVNLLVILAGTLLALLLIQWRVCAKSLYGLTLHRRLPRAMQARKDFEIELSIKNPKRWLGCWLVLAQDRMVYQPYHQAIKPVSQSIGILFSSIPPGTSRSQKYRCRVHRRGRYQFLGTEITTRFPVGLMRGILPAGGGDIFVVQPAIGKLLPGWFELFESKSSGLKQRKSRSLSDEGDFFGLRDYRSGDSPRWIHWRSSARRNELMVKQFQRSDSRELIVLLDLYAKPSATRDESEASSQSEDQAVEFVATVAQFVAASNYGVLTLGIADAEPTIALRVQTRSQNVSLLDRLGTAHAGKVDGLPRALELLEREHRRVENLIVISTRPQPPSEMFATVGRSIAGPNVGSAATTPQAIVFWKHCTWIDVSAGELAPYFAPAPAT